MRVDAYGTSLANISPILGAEAKHLDEIIQTNDYSSPERSLKTAGSDIIRLVRQAREAGINDEVRPSPPHFPSAQSTLTIAPKNMPLSSRSFAASGPRGHAQRRTDESRQRRRSRG